MPDEHHNRLEFFERLAPLREQFVARWRTYYDDLHDLLTFLIRPDASVVEIGCGTAAVVRRLPNTKRTGIDFSPAMIAEARRLDPAGNYLVADIEKLNHQQKYDAVLLLDTVNELVDVEQALKEIRQNLCHQRTRLIITFHNFLWKSVLTAAQGLGLKTPTPPENWLTVNDVETLLNLADFEVVRSGERFLCPVRIPLVTTFFNRFLVHLPPFSWFALTHFIVARPVQKEPKEYSVSVIVPVRNEAGTISRIVESIPVLGTGTEVIFVEGHSKDDTWQRVQQVSSKYRGPLKIRAVQQTGIGKGDAVRTGFAQAENEVLMILDGDLGVEAAELKKFYDALAEGKGELINGSRLVYPMEGQAMRFINLIGNKTFSWIFTWILGQRIKDTLCGTKVILAQDYAHIAAHRSYFGTIDPFGDFDLLLGAAKQSLRIIEIPVRYHERKYGATNISRFRHGLLLFRMVFRAAFRLNFAPLSTGSGNTLSLTAVAGSYAFLLGAGLFIWPVVVGIPLWWMRAGWILAALVLTLCSIVAAFRIAGKEAPLKIGALNWFETWPLIIGSLLLLPILTAVPPHAFSDETNVAIPALTIFHRASQIVPWPVLFAGAIIFLFWFVSMPLRRFKVVAGLMLAFAVFSLFIAFLIPETSVLSVRYPPLVHLVQSVTTLLTAGDWHFIRLPNLLWTLLLLPVIWYGRPSWSVWQRYVLFAGLLLGPLAWSFRTELYQACGELTFGLAACLLLDQLLKSRDRRVMLLTGIVLALWVLYRPTAIIAIGLILFVLVILRRFREALGLAAITLPPAIAWLSLYPLYRYDFLLSGQGLFPAAQNSASFLQAMALFFSSLPLTMHPAVFAILILTTLVVLFVGGRDERRLLLIAWLIAFPLVFLQQMVLPADIRGYARYDLLMHLPLAVGLGIVAGLGFKKKLGGLIALVAVIVLIFVTPWNIEAYRQQVRTGPWQEMYRHPTAGETSLPVAKVALEMIKQGQRPIIVAPDSGFLELTVAGRLITPEERTEMLAAGNNWTTDQTARPVLVQAPTVTTYRPNIPLSREEFLKSARDWALKQPGHLVVRSGIEEVVIVP
jgi:glycosyltransferase involved in cell wall biosynthesis